MTKVTKLPNSRVKIESTLSSEILNSYHDKALADIKKFVKIDGFRDGQAPDGMIEKHVGPLAVNEKMAELALAEAYLKILTDEKIDAIGRPVVIFGEVKTDADTTFSIETDVMPSIELGDYKKAAKSATENPVEVTVTDEEVDQAIRELRQMRAHQKMHDDGVEHDNHNHQEIADDQLPELNDEFVKSLSVNFENVEDFKNKLRDNMKVEKTAQQAEKIRMDIMDALITESNIEIPAVMSDFELDKMIEQFTGELAHSGMKWDDYLKMIGKSQEEIRTEWRENAEKRAKIQLIIDTISDRENVKPSDDEISAETAKMMDMYREHADIDEDRVRAYVTQMLINSGVMKFLTEGK
jgi:FKBP-type peptidyl-prolyl cis-trans isomerase (trigger factor)